MSTTIEALRGGLIVSCQAAHGSPLASPTVLAALALAAEAGGAVGIRADGPEAIAAITRAVRVPVIAIRKVVDSTGQVWITPTPADARVVHTAGDPSPAIIAFDATDRPRPHGEGWRPLLAYIQADLGALAMADISTLDEGLAAAEAGADLIATTLSGYTAYTADRMARPGPDLELVHALARRTDIPILCEGRVQSPDQARAALDAGAYAVVVGTAITAIDQVARTYAKALGANNF
jgi:N-acylglucosamine-6-phosphate 2-epimerase